MATPQWSLSVGMFLCGRALSQTRDAGEAFQELELGLGLKMRQAWPAN